MSKGGGAPAISQVAANNCRRVMMLVKAGAPVESTIDLLMPLLEKGDIIIDGGNEWYENTEHRQKKVADKGLMYLGMGVSGGEEGARNGKASGI